jgi:hypothetical protein
MGDVTKNIDIKHGDNPGLRPNSAESAILRECNGKTASVVDSSADIHFNGTKRIPVPAGKLLAAFGQDGCIKVSSNVIEICAGLVTDCS